MAFILAVTVCFLFLVAGLPMVLDTVSGWAPEALVLAVANLSFLSHFDSLQKGVVTLGDVIYFVAVIVFWLWVNRIVIESKREAG